ncbi:Rhodopirellula transposase (plasmid) [Tautonia plasticadhaerens]|uniref:Rhodopirellula transposase n=2 Tax=Tautonia plasticadhaerens TaxID=2527974 RepID=A0A518H4A3_9BACT|nr:Rhodopirellula transposase [Tautonia plasticadhaerens]QDV35684.1 Rhodopirellula transposase [Tautonia plasticadhaerens]QDV36448.1 Rhodopirellula transposase [Tautonia plasticadhaerens]QDV37347.1 Rhodopirellula transposase [Tautonia plasticadhaerens]QDV37791.1 Rhodopirellula transposase [Tautonia plasticadhaerens]
MGPTEFVRRSLPAIGADLERLGHDLSPTTIARLLRDQDCSLRVNRKRFTGPDHPDRDRQSRNIDERIAIFEGLGQPIIGVDSKKKELVGNFKNAGAAWLREPEEVNVYDFLSDAECRATPYGICDVLSGRGHVCVGTSADTPAFAVEAIGSWWARHGSERYRGADELLILADGGGSNGHRPRLWKARLQERIADRYGLHVTVCHYPTGASKWNPVEHRLFGPVSINWAGQPLRSLEAMLGWARGTEVGGAGVTASLDRAEYPTKVKVPAAVMERLDRERHEVCPDWNDTISPRQPQVLH